MKPQLRFAAAAVLALALAIAAAPQQKLPRAIENPDITLPDGKSQQDAILKADHERDLKDAAQLIELSEQLKAELEKNDRHVLSISSIKKTEEIEKLARRIRARIKH